MDALALPEQSGTSNGSAPPVDNFSEASLGRHYAAVRRRLFNSKPPEAPSKVIPSQTYPISEHWPPLYEEPPEQLSRIVRQEHPASRVIRLVAAHFGVTRADILSDSHRPEHARPRQVCFWLCRTELRLSLCNIGSRFNRDHTSIMFGLRRVAKFAAEDPAFKAAIAMLVEQIKGDPEPT